MAGKSCSGFKTELLGDTGCGQEGLTKQSDTGRMGGCDHPRPPVAWSMCPHLSREVGQDEGHPGKMVETGGGLQYAKAVSQGAAVGPQVPRVHYQDIPRDGAYPNGTSKEGRTSDVSTKKLSVSLTLALARCVTVTGRFISL